MKKLWIGLLIMMLLAGGCSAGSEQAADYAPAEEPAAMEAPGEDYGDYDMVAEDEMMNSDGSVDFSEQKLIMEGSIRVTVTDAVETSEEIKVRVESLGGYISSINKYSHNYDGQEYYSVDMNIRVPGESFEALRKEIEGLGKMEHSSTNTQDVTQQYIDLEARIKNLKSEEERFVAIFDQANTVEDMLAVEREIARLRGEIESLEGQFRYLKNRVNYASLYVSLDEEHTKTAEFEGLSLSQFLKRMGSSFSRGVYGFFVFVGNLFIQLAYMLPFLVFLAVVIFLIYLPVKRWRKKKGDRLFRGGKQDKGSDENEQA